MKRWQVTCDRCQTEIGYDEGDGKLRWGKLEYPDGRIRDLCKHCFENVERIVDGATVDWAISEKDVVTAKDHPTMLSTANEIKRIIDDRLKNDRYDTEPIPVSQHVLVWAEYWLRWACEHVER